MKQNKQIYYGYWLIIAAFVAQFISVGVQNYVIGPFMIPMIEELGWCRAEYTIPRTLGQAMMALTGFVIGGHVDSFGAKRFMLVGVIILAFALSFKSHRASLSMATSHWVRPNRWCRPDW